MRSQPDRGDYGVLLVRPVPCFQSSQFSRPGPGTVGTDQQGCGQLASCRRGNDDVLSAREIGGFNTLVPEQGNVGAPANRLKQRGNRHTVFFFFKQKTAYEIFW